MDASRNDPCPCGSGQKYKRCCIDKVEGGPRIDRKTLGICLVAAVVVGLALGFFSGVRDGLLGGLTAAMFVGGFQILRNPPPPSGRSGNAAGIDFGK